MLWGAWLGKFLGELDKKYGKIFLGNCKNKIKNMWPSQLCNCVASCIRNADYYSEDVSCSCSNMSDLFQSSVHYRCERVQLIKVLNFLTSVIFIFYISAANNVLLVMKSRAALGSSWNRPTCQKLTFICGVVSQTCCITFSSFSLVRYVVIVGLHVLCKGFLPPDARLVTHSLNFSHRNHAFPR